MHLRFFEGEYPQVRGLPDLVAQSSGFPLHDVFAVLNDQVLELKQQCQFMQTSIHLAFETIETYSWSVIRCYCCDTRSDAIATRFCGNKNRETGKDTKDE